MNFVSWAFLVLLTVVMAARLTVGRRKIDAPFVAVLLAASLLFYAWHIPAYLSVLLVSSTIDYVAALAIVRHPPGSPARRRWLVASLASNLGLLAVFKYAAFAAHTAEALAAAGGIDLRLPELGLILPMGISFYTFQTLSYTIDVYRGTLAPIHRYGQFLLYISFFPQLVAGPIVRASEFLPQMPRPRRLHARAFYRGAWLILLGYFLKMVVADNLAAYVDEHWDRGTRADGNATFAWWLALMFSGQIFADFCGYSTIAQGLGYWLGYRFPLNFNAPYLAASFKNFWERWHITLSRWLRDYLYVPLGGNRGTRLRTGVNLMAVMLLGGLWHGAAWTFVLWGGIHGACLAVERALGLQRREAVGPGARLLWAGVVQLAVLVTWIVFRSASLADALRFVRNLVAGAWTAPEAWMGQAMLFLAPVVALHAVTWLRERGRAPALTPAMRGVLAALMAYAILTLHGGTSDFIYFQF